ncbi:MAG: LLM class flavin-dependent oxidoreductase [Candidatus Binatia bacterium]
MRDTALKFGAFIVPFHSVREDVTTLLHRDLDVTVHLDRIGYDEVWYGEHHSGGMEIIAAPEVFAGIASERTKHIKLGTAVVSLPYQHPFMLADRIVMLDHLTRGRFLFGVGPGALTSDAVQMGIDPLKQRPMMVEAIEAIVRLFRGEIVTMKTDWFELREARLQLPNYSSPHVDMTVAVGASPAGAVAAGQFGLGVLNISGVSDAVLQLNVGHWQITQETAREYGQAVDRSRWRIASLIHLAETRERAIEEVQHGLDEWVQYFREVSSFAIVPSNIADPLEYLLGERMAAIGTPDDAIRHIERIWDATGGFGVHLELVHNWANPEATLRSHELMMRYVKPHFRDGFASRRQNWTWCHSHMKEFANSRNVAVQVETERHERERAKKVKVARGRAAPWR